MNRLWLRLSLAFIIVTQLSIFIITGLAGWSTIREFRNYVIRRELVISGRLADNLGVFYSQNGSWVGVDRLLAASAEPGDGKRSDVPFNHFIPLPQPLITMPKGGDPFIARFAMPQPLLTDPNWQVIYDQRGARIGNTIGGEERTLAVPIEQNGIAIGYLAPDLVAIDDFLRHAPENDYLTRLRDALSLGAVITGAISVVTALVLSRTVVAPLSNLAQTARAFAAHNWNRRVKVRGTSEVADVARAFNEMADEIERSETLRRNMIADIAHELRTPLTVMQGNLRALLDQVYPMERGEIAILYDETRVLSRLVDDLRELALADAGKLTLTFGMVDIHEILASTVANFAIVAENQNVQLAVNVPPAVPPVRADLDRLTQIIRNLMINALHHSPGGSVTVAADLVPEGSDPPKMVRICVSDTGEGITPEELPVVFDRFYRGDKSRARISGSSGLGLAIAKAWVEAMGGKIGVESAPGKGSSFWFVLPTA